MLLLVVPGCIRPATRLVYASEPTADESVPDQGPVREIQVAEDTPIGEAAEPVPSRRALPPLLPPPDPVLFRLGTGYGALGQVDLSPCRAQGLQPGYMRMRVTFRRSGHVVRAALQSLLPQPGEALACVGDVLETAMVPAFDGDDVTLSRSVFVN